MPRAHPNPAQQRADLLAQMQALSSGDGNAPTLAVLAAHGFSLNHIYRHFGSYASAAAAAGLKLARHNTRVDANVLLTRYGEALEQLGRAPTQPEFRLLGHGGSKPIARLFGGWAGVAPAFRRFAEGDPRWASALERLAAQPGGPPPRPLPVHGRRAATSASALGDPLQFRALLHAPLCELGVVFLFGMLAGELGYLVEQFQAGFPDCTALRRIGTGRWERVRIEVE